MECFLSFSLLFNSFSLYRIIINYLPSQDRNERYLFYEIRRFLKRQIAFIGLLYLLIFSVRLNPPEKLAIYVYIYIYALSFYLFIFIFLSRYIHSYWQKRKRRKKKREYISAIFMCKQWNWNGILCFNWLKDHIRWRYVFRFLFLVRYKYTL